MVQDYADVFLWATNVEPLKSDVAVDLFLFDKNYEIYTVQVAEELRQQLKKQFLYEMLRYVREGAAKGLGVRDFEMSEKEDNVLQRTSLARVENAAKIIHNIEEEEADLDPFTEESHEFKSVKGMLARFSHPSLGKPFYIMKVVKQSQALKGDGAWMFSGNSFRAFDAAAGLRVTADNQALIIDGTVFVFDEAKFETMFKYNAKLQHLAHQKVTEIEANFNLSLPEEVDLQHLLKGKKRLVKKLQEIDMGDIEQNKLMEHADELGVDLMLDDVGAIIIADGNDLNKFVNLLNDDYITSSFSGVTYEIKNKKPLEKEKGESGA